MDKILSWMEDDLFSKKLNLLIIINNHNSFKIVELIHSLQKVDPTISYKLVCESKYLPNIIKKLPHELNNIEEINNYFKFFFQKRITKNSSSNAKDSSTSNLSLKDNMLKRYIKIFLEENSLILFLKEIIIHRRIEYCKTQAFKILQKNSYSAVLSLSDRTHDYVESSIQWAAKSLGIKIVLPYIANYSIDAAYLYRLDKDKNVLSNLNINFPISIYRLYSLIFLKKHIFKDCYFQSPFLLNAHRRSRTLSFYSWWVGNGISDIVCVNSNHVKNIYIENGVPEYKIKIVGDVSYTEVYNSLVNKEQIRIDLIKELFLDKDKKIIIFTVPQYLEQGYLDANTHWETIEYVVDLLSRQNLNIILSLHPRHKVEDYKFLKEKYNVSISSKQLSFIIGSADYFVSSQSSTLIWAVLCGIPSLDFDFHVNFNLYHFLNSVKHVRSKLNFEKNLSDLIHQSSPNFHDDWETLSKDLVFQPNIIENYFKIIHN